MKKKIRDHLKLFMIQIYQLEREANDGNITREEAIKGFEDNLFLFTGRINGEFQELRIKIDNLFED